MDREDQSRERESENQKSRGWSQNKKVLASASEFIKKLKFIWFSLLWAVFFNIKIKNFVC